jgi:hypothetical protein
MYNLLISFGSGVVTTILFGYLFGMPRISVVGGIVPGIIVMIGVFVVLSRRAGKKLEALMLRVQEELKPQTPGKIDPNRFRRAVDILKSGYALGKWQLLVNSQLNAQIGMLHFVTRSSTNPSPTEKALAATGSPRPCCDVFPPQADRPHEGHLRRSPESNQEGEPLVEPLCLLFVEGRSARRSHRRAQQSHRNHQE